MRLGTSTTMGFNRPHGVKADIPDVVRILAEAGFSGYLKGKDVEAVLARLYPRFEFSRLL